MLLGEGYGDHSSSPLEAPRADTEEWEFIKSALSWDDMRLETIERMLDSFGEAVSITRASMAWDLYPLWPSECSFSVVPPLTFRPMFG